jgi:AcrR family transcriptional regulator
MADQPDAGRKPRADAARNRELLLATAKRVFAAKGNAASLDEIARAAGLGIGTLYRHFPTRDALVEQVYRHETMQLAEAARQLAATQTPAEALRQWLCLFVDYFSTKQTMVAALSAASGGPATLFAFSSAILISTVTSLAERAALSGEIVLSVEPTDLLRAISGIANLNAGPGWEQNAKKLVDIILSGMAVRAS